MSNTRLQVRQQIIKNTRLGLMLAATASDAGSFNTFTDATLRAIASDLVLLDEGAPLVITSTGTTAAVWGSESRISSTAITSGGVITLSPALSASAKVNQTAEVWHRDLKTVETVNDAIEWTAANLCSRWAFPVLTFLKDGDFWKKTIDTGEWAVTNATQSRVAFSFPNFLGQRIHRVTNSAANGYSAQSLNVNEGDTWRFEVMVRAYTGTAQITAYDVTNSAAITLSGTASADEGDWVWLKTTFTVPSGCRVVSFRLGGALATAVADYACAAAWPEGTREFPFQPRITTPDQVRGFYALSGRSSEEGVWKQKVTPWPMGEPKPFTTPAGLVARFGYAPASSGPALYAEKTFYEIGDSGTATGSSATTLTDALKAWTTDQWIGAKVVAEGKWMTVTSNTATVLTGAAWNGGTPATTATYTLQGDLGTTDAPLEYLAAMVSLVLANRLYEQAERAEHATRAEGFVNPWARLRKDMWNLAKHMDSRYGAVERTLEQYSERG
jgi:hypothetical protein